MQSSKPLNHPFRDHASLALAASGLLLIFWVVGCGRSSSSSSPPPLSPTPQTYFAPTVEGTGYGQQTYIFDDKAATFSQTVYASLLAQPGPQILNAGVQSVSQRGLRSLGISTTYVYEQSSPPTYVPQNFNPSQPGSFAVELSGQAGGFAQLLGQPVAPLVAASKCPNFSSAQSYQFVTIPGALLPAGTTPASNAWDPINETAFGSVDISSSGSTVNFQNIQQFTLPSVGGSGAPTQPPPSSLTGTCAQTYFGYTIAVPGQAVISNPGVPGSGNNAVSPQAILGIGASGLLVEDNGSGSGSPLVGSSPPFPYDNVMGAGTGAVGLPKPSAALDTGAIASAQYLGFIYAAGKYNNGSSATGWSSHLTSFGFSTVPSSCASIAASTGTLIYGGDYPNDNPSASSDGFGNCDFAVDLGSQDSANNGRYSHATVWVGASYAANSTGTTYSFPAVAISGQLNGKYAIFLIGTDSSQPWAIYLLQSN